MIIHILLSFLLLIPAAHATDEPMLAFCNALLSINATQASANTTEQAPIIRNVSYGQRHKEALAALGEANQSVQSLELQGLPSVRARDSYLLALQWFNGQSAIERGGGQFDYSQVFQRTSEVKTVSRLCLSTNDELAALSVRLQGVAPDVNLTETLALQKQAKQEFLDGRFENAKSFIDQAYTSVASAEADATRSSTLLDTTRRNLETFLQENWHKILAALAGVLIFAFIFQRQIRRFLLEGRMRVLLSERKVLEDMLRKLQKDYFDEHGNLSDMAYRIKTNKYSNMIRDINRQLPLVKEELKRI